MNKGLVILIAIFFPIAFHAQSVGGSISGSTVVCSGLNNGVLSLTSYSGSILRWEFANSSNGPWTPLLQNSSSYNYINLSSTLYFRVVIQQTGYAAAYSSTAVVQCDNVVVPGSISAASLHCISNSPTVNLAGTNGTVLGWWISQDNWINSYSISPATTTLAIPNFTANTQVKALVSSGVCPAAFTNSLQIMVAMPSVGGTITGATAVCSGTNNIQLLLSGQIGIVEQWESGSTVSGPYNAIANTTGTGTLQNSNLTQNVSYRVRVRNADCPAAYSGTATVTVLPIPQAGFVSGPSGICSNRNLNLSLFGYAGQIANWQFSSNNGISWSNINAQQPTLTIASATQSGNYRAIISSSSCGTVASGSLTVNVLPLPVISFSAVGGCAGRPMYFNNQTTGATTFYWDFGDGTSSPLLNPGHTYSAQGNFSVHLTANSSNGCTDSAFSVVNISGGPNVHILAPDSTCQHANIPIQVLFQPTATTSYSLYFGDGTMSTNAPFSHIYTLSGNFHLKSVAATTSGCADSTVHFLKVIPAPVSSFSWSRPCQSQTTTLIDLTVGPHQSLWLLPGQQIASISQPTVSFSNSGTSFVTLISTVNGFCSDTVSHRINVHPVPKVSISRSHACENSPITFSAATSPSTHLTYKWSIANKSVSDSCSFTYHSEGWGWNNYTLKSTTDSGCSVLINGEFMVNPMPRVSFEMPSSCAGKSITPINHSSISKGSVNYLWRVDNDTSYSFAPLMMIRNSKKHMVYLECKSDSNCRAIDSLAYIAFANPEISFSMSNSCLGEFCVANNNTRISEGYVIAHHWDFGDNTYSNEIRPAKIFISHGTHTVTLQCFSEKGCETSLSQTLEVYPANHADFMGYDACTGIALQFTNISRYAGVDSVKWQMSDGFTSNFEHATHAFSKPGSYQVSLLLKSDKGCRDSITRTIYVHDNPVSPIIRDTTIDGGKQLKLANTSTFAATWNPAIGLNDPVSPNPVFTADSSRTYRATFMNEYGCVVNSSVHVTVEDNFMVEICNLLTPDGNGLNDTWVIKNIELYPDNHVLVMDMNGRSIFEKSGYLNDWKGTDANGLWLPDATYYYLLSFKNSTKIYKGYVVMMR